MAVNIKYKNKIIAEAFNGQVVELDVNGHTFSENLFVESYDAGECTERHIIEVTELPSDNIDENAVYKCDNCYYEYKKSLLDIILCESEGNDRQLIYGSDVLSLKCYYVETRPEEGIISDLNNGIQHVYYVEDENHLFVYGDEGNGKNEWSSLVDAEEFKGIITNPAEAVEFGIYALVSDYSKYLSPNEVIQIKEGGIFDVTNAFAAHVDVSTSYVVQSSADLPLDATEGSFAFVLGGD